MTALIGPGCGDRLRELAERCDRGEVVALAVYHEDRDGHPHRLMSRGPCNDFQARVNLRHLSSLFRHGDQETPSDG